MTMDITNVIVMDMAIDEMMTSIIHCLLPMTIAVVEVAVVVILIMKKIIMEGMQEVVVEGEETRMDIMMMKEDINVGGTMSMMVEVRHR